MSSIAEEILSGRVLRRARRWGPNPRKAPKNPAHGERHYRAGLTDAQVRALREARSSEQATYKQLSFRFGCSWPTVRDIVKGWTRADAGGPIEEE
jgi:hypothetical protein